MFRPTRYQEHSISSSGWILERDIPIFGTILEESEVFFEALTRLRYERHMDRKPVIGTCVEEAKELVSFPLPEGTIEENTGLNGGMWGTIYRKIVFDGVGWGESFNEYWNSSGPAESRITLNVGSDAELHENGVLIKLDGMEDIKVFTEEDLTEYGKIYDTISVSFHTPKIRNLIRSMSGRDVSEIEVTFNAYNPTPRYYISEPPEYLEDPVARMIEELETPLSDRGFQVLFSTVSKLGLGSDFRILLILYIQGVLDTICLDYGYYTPKFTWEVANLLGEDIAHVPQTGEIFISRNSLDEIKHFVEEFPEKQTLGPTEQYELYSLVYPDGVAARWTEGSWTEQIGFETVARLVDSGEFDRRDVANYTLCPWPADTTEQSARIASSFGNRVRDALVEFDAHHGTDVAEYVLTRVDDEGKRIYWD